MHLEFGSSRCKKKKKKNRFLIQSTAMDGVVNHVDIWHLIFAVWIFE